MLAVPSQVIALDFLSPVSFLETEEAKREKYYDRLGQQVAKELGFRSEKDLKEIDYEDSGIFFGSNYYGTERWANQNKPNLSKREPVFELIRVGRLIFLDREAYARLSEKSKRDLGDNLIVIDNLSLTKLAREAIGSYTMVSIAAMLNGNLENNTWIDLGAGEGILSVVAAKLGAKHLILVEYESLKDAENNLRLNGLKEGEDFTLVNDDLKKHQEIVADLKAKNLLEGKICVVSNIGNWENYVITNLTSIAFVEDLENPDIFFILSGYDSIRVRRYTQDWSSDKLEHEHDYLRVHGFDPTFIDSKSMLHEGGSGIKKDGDDSLHEVSSTPLKRDAALLGKLSFMISQQQATSIYKLKGSSVEIGQPTAIVATKGKGWKQKESKELKLHHFKVNADLMLALAA